jgi:DNA-binding transcriptional regulator YiaG
MNGSEIRSLRKQLGFTQEEFAHEIGVTFATVNRWENGKSRPSRLALKMLATLNDGTESTARDKGGARKSARKTKSSPRRRARR